MKIRYSSILILILILGQAGSISAQSSDSALVRVRIDVDSAMVKVDQSETDRDSFGNPLTKGNWFILKLATGKHEIEVDAYSYGIKDSSVVVLSDQVLTLDFIFEEVREIVADSGNVIFYSDPVGAEIRIDKNPAGLGTPLISTLIPGSHYVEAVLEGYETLSEQIEVDDSLKISVKLRLRESRPFPYGPADIEMEFLPLFPVRDTAEAQQITDRFNGLAESFMVVPLAQGILARIAAGKEQRKEADILVLAGVTLTAGSYLLGKIFSLRRKKEVIAFNEEVEIKNRDAVEQNAEVKKILQRTNSERIKAWRGENDGRGVVVVEERP